jgi:membrane associated rhomboid family serine protease
MVIPLYDHDPSDFKVPPYVTWCLIAVNVVVFLVEQATGGGEFLMMSYGAVPAVIAGKVPNPSPIPAWATLVTSMFLHNGWLHVSGNMLYLFVFGDDIEEAMGWWRFLLFYLASGILAALAYVACNLDSVGPMIGASGAIAGVLAAYLMLRQALGARVLPPRPDRRNVGDWHLGRPAGLRHPLGQRRWRGIRCPHRRAGGGSAAVLPTAPARRRALRVCRGGYSSLKPYSGTLPVAP